MSERKQDILETIKPICIYLSIVFFIFDIFVIGIELKHSVVAEIGANILNQWYECLDKQKPKRKGEWYDIPPETRRTLLIVFIAVIITSFAGAYIELIVSINQTINNDDIDEFNESADSIKKSVLGLSISTIILSIIAMIYTYVYEIFFRPTLAIGLLNIATCLGLLAEAFKI